MIKRIQGKTYYSTAKEAHDISREGDKVIHDEGKGYRIERPKTKKKDNGIRFGLP
ncbi:MAG: hypothetical protein Q7U51_08310 [Methanoregula sp.]|nr:hypothetical protein [Methanoregula sp.]